MASSSSSLSIAWWFISSILFATVPGALCDDNYNIKGLVAAGAVAFLLFAVIIAMIGVGLTWNNWYPKIQWANGKVKMPKAYWKKKEEAKLRLVYGSRSGLASLAAPSESGLPNGNTSSRVRDTGSHNASWVQGWNNANHMDDGGYEEMALAMDLGEEDKEEDVRIVTTVLDNEALDLGPFHDEGDPPPAATSTAIGAARASTRTSSQGGAGDRNASSRPLVSTEMAETDNQPGDDSYVYSTVDRSAKKTTSTPRADADIGGGETATGGTAGPSGGDEGPAATSEKVTSFSKMDPYLVAL